MSLYLRFAATSDVGRVRRDNQDSGYAGAHLLVVADGVGGAARGDIASSATVEVLRKLDVPAGDDALSEIAATLHLAHDRLAEIVEAHPDLDGTSTTVSAAIFDGTHLQIGHVGDSRGYLMRDGILTQLTSDHSLVQSLVDEGRITEEEARVHPHRNLILKAVDSVHEPEPDLFSAEVQAGDRLLFCSDGCSGVLDDETMAALLGADPLESAAAALVHAALEGGSSDNVTVVVAEVLDGAAPSTTSPVIVGAAATNPHLEIDDDATGNLTPSETAELQEAIDPEAIRYAPLPPPKRVWLRRLTAVVVILALLGGLGFAGYQYSQTRYYLTAVQGDQVVLNRGVDFNLPLIRLHHVAQTMVGYTKANLGPTYTDIDAKHPDFGSQADAKAYLRKAYCAEVAEPTLPPTPTPTAPVTSKPTLAAPSTSKTGTATTKPRTTPTRSATSKSTSKAAPTHPATPKVTLTPTATPTPTTAPTAAAFASAQDCKQAP